MANSSIQLPHTFSKSGYSVTVQRDRSIRVQPNDWLSKYSLAIYGNYDDANIEKFCELETRLADGTPVYKRIENKDLIHVNQLVYHPGPLPGEGPHTNPGIVPPFIPDLGKPNRVQPTRVSELLHWLGSIASPASNWTLDGNGSIDLNGLVFLNAHGLKLVARHNIQNQVYDFYGVGLGVGLSLAPASLSISPMDAFASGGRIMKLPSAGTDLGPNEICGTYVAFEFGAGWFVGGTATLLFFGFNMPPQFVIRNVASYLRGDPYVTRPFMAMGFLLMIGFNATTPDLGITVKQGVIHRKECFRRPA